MHGHTWVHGYMSAWMHRCMDTWVHGCIGEDLHGFYFSSGNWEDGSMGKVFAEHAWSPESGPSTTTTKLSTVVPAFNPSAGHVKWRQEGLWGSLLAGQPC